MITGLCVPEVPGGLPRAWEQTGIVGFSLLRLVILCRPP